MEQLDEARYYVECALAGERIPAMTPAVRSLFFKVVNHSATFAPELTRERNLTAAPLMLSGLPLPAAEEAVRNSVRSCSSDFALKALVGLGFERLTLDYMWSLGSSGFGPESLLETERSSVRVRAAAAVLGLLPHFTREEVSKASAKMFELTPPALETFCTLAFDSFRSGSARSLSKQAHWEFFEELLISASLLESE